MTQDRKSTRTVFAWAWTLFGNGHLWQRALTWTKDDPFAVEVANPNFTSVAVPLYTDEELSAALPSALDLPSPPSNSKTNPFIICGKRKFIDPEWLKRKIETDPEEGEIGAGFEMFPSAIPSAPDAEGVEPVAWRYRGDFIGAKLDTEVARLTALLAEADEVVKLLDEVADYMGSHYPDAPGSDEMSIWLRAFRAARRYQQKREAK